MNNLFKNILADFYWSLSFFSRLPLEWIQSKNLSFAFSRTIWVWPLIGLFLGSIIGVFFFLLCHTGLSGWIVALVTLGFQLLITGGLHEDGLADMADGLGGGKNKEQQLQIMRDSRLGSYGAMALFIVLGIKICALSQFASTPLTGWIALSITGSLARMSIVILLLGSQPACKNGLASQFTSFPSLSAWMSLISGIVICFVITPNHAAVLLLGILISSGTICLLTNRQIGGYTGDVLGATESINEALILSLLSTYY